MDNNKELKEIECFMCGACCIVLSISSLNKPEMEPCIHLDKQNKCMIYTTRPEVCKEFKADENCLKVKGLEHNQLIKQFAKIYEIE